MAIKARYPHTWGRYGFWDAFNPSFNYPDIKLTHGRIEPGRAGWTPTCSASTRARCWP
jgi:hypothetical protein